MADEKEKEKDKDKEKEKEPERKEITTAEEFREWVKKLPPQAFVNGYFRVWQETGSTGKSDFGRKHLRDIPANFEGDDWDTLPQKLREWLPVSTKDGGRFALQFLDENKQPLPKSTIGIELAPVEPEEDDVDEERGSDRDRDRDRDKDRAGISSGIVEAMRLMQGSRDNSGKIDRLCETVDKLIQTVASQPKDGGVEKLLMAQISRAEQETINAREQRKADFETLEKRLQIEADNHKKEEQERKERFIKEQEIERERIKAELEKHKLEMEKEEKKILAQLEAEKLRIAEDRQKAKEERDALERKLEAERVKGEKDRELAEKKMEEDRKIAEAKMAEERRMVEAKMAEERRMTEAKMAEEKERWREEVKQQRERFEKDLVIREKESVSRINEVKEDAKERMLMMQEMNKKDDNGILKAVTDGMARTMEASMGMIQNAQNVQRIMMDNVEDYRERVNSVKGGSEKPQAMTEKLLLTLVDRATQIMVEDKKNERAKLLSQRPVMQPQAQSTVAGVQTEKKTDLGEVSSERRLKMLQEFVAKLHPDVVRIIVGSIQSEAPPEMFAQTLLNYVGPAGIPILTALPYQEIVDAILEVPAIMKLSESAKQVLKSQKAEKWWDELRKEVYALVRQIKEDEQIAEEEGGEAESSENG